MVQVLEVKTEMVKVMPDEPAIGTFWEDEGSDIWVRAYDGTWRIAQYKGYGAESTPGRAGGGCNFSQVMNGYGPLTEVSDPLTSTVAEPAPVFAMVPEVAFAEWWTAARERSLAEWCVFNNATTTFMTAVYKAGLNPDADLNNF